MISRIEEVSPTTNLTHRLQCALATAIRNQPKRLLGNKPGDFLDFYDKIRKADNTISRYQLALEMLEKGSDALKIAVAGNILTLADLFDAVNSVDTDFESLREYAKTEDGKKYIERAISCAKFHLPQSDELITKQKTPR